MNRTQLCHPEDSAFPTQRPFELRDKDGRVSIVEHFWAGGLSKREYFASCALQGLAAYGAGYENAEQNPKQACALLAIAIADALIDELNKEAAA